MRNLLAAIATSIIVSSCGTQQPASVEDKETPKSEVKSNPSDEKTTTPKTLVNDTIKGIDVSHFNGDVNWAQVKEAGYHFTYIKATGGNTFNDPKFEENWINSEKSGLKKGAYHFYIAKDDPKTQAEHFLKIVGEYSKSNLAPVLDLEGENIDDLTIEQYQINVSEWLQIVDSVTGIQPIIYTNHVFGSKYLNNEKFAKYKLWIAEYSDHAPIIPEIWKANGWSMWQSTANDKVPGIVGDVDEDYMIIKVEK